MFYKNQFAIIVKKIYKTYSNQNDFAKAAGVDRSYISLMLNMKLDNPPKPIVLKRIANSSRGIISYEELMQICGYIDIEKCNMESTLFNAKIEQNEMIIPVEKYSAMENKIDELSNTIEKLNKKLAKQKKLNQKFKNILSICQKDNKKIENKIANFLNELGG